jgi:serine/threonine protein kinase
MSDTQGSRAGSTFGPYHLKRLLGRGGMGEVYEAEHTVKEWTVAVKVMTAEFSKDPVFRERMKREARIAGRLQEPHVVPIHDYGEIDGQMYLEMRLVEGTDLDSLLKRFGPMTPPRAVAIISQIASALDAAHAAGVMHRDIKPPNILVTREDFAYLVDFGIASATTDEKLTQLGTAVGTWKYMAPERFSNDEVTYRADIYALACVLYEALTGAQPYRSDSASVLVTAHLMDPIPQPSAARAGIPRAFDAVIARGMAKKPEDRYASAGDLALAAHEALSTPDQDHADNILRRSQEATMLGTGTNTPPPYFAGTGVSTPPPSRQSFAAPPPASTQRPPYPGPVTSGPPPGNQPATSAQYYQAPSSWGGQPTSAPPPQQPGGATSWNQTQPPAKRKSWPIVAGAAALALILVIAAVYFLTKKSGDTPQAGQSSSVVSTTSSAATTTSLTTRSNDPQTKLQGLLPKGYALGVCTASTPPAGSVWRGSVAMVKCGPNSATGGPSNAVYGLFPNLNALKKAFNDDIAAVQLGSCPGDGPSPEGWHYKNNPDVTAGMLACGTFKNQPNVVWSNEGKLMLSDVFAESGTLAALHEWWTHNG